MATEQGFSNQKKKGNAQFKTIHSSGSDSYSEQVIPKYLSDLVVPPVTSFISTITDILGLNGQVEFWEIAFIDPHYAIKGDVYRIKGSADDLFNFEFEIVSVVDANTIRVLPISDVKPTSSDFGTIKRWVTANSDSEGNPQITIPLSPIQFVKDNATIPVTEDTITPANNAVLPAGLFIYKDGAQIPITKDTGTPSNTVGIPVEIVAASGTPINITAGDINVQLTDLGTNFDAVRLGDGTGNYVGVNASDEAKVHDADALTALNSIDGKFTTLNAKDFATSAKQDTGNTSLSSIDGKLQNNGVIDAGNSSVTPLGIGGVFTGIAFDVTKYASINVCLISDVPSATDGVKLEVSTDGVNWDHNHKTTYSAATGVGYIFNAEFKFARVVYTNGAVAQSYFRLQTIFKSNYVAPSLYTLDQTVTGTMFAQLNKSTIIGKTTGGGGGFVDVKVNPSGALTVEASVTGSVSVTNFPATQPVSGSVSVSNFPTTQAVTGTFFQATQPVSAADLPLPTGASTSALQTALNNKTAAGLVVSEHDEIVTTYVGATTRINTVVYKLATVTVATITMSYDGSDRLVGVVRS